MEIINSLICSSVISFILSLIMGCIFGIYYKKRVTAAFDESIQKAMSQLANFTENTYKRKGQH